MLKLTKISNNENELRTKEILGTLVSPVIVGKSICFLAKPFIPEADARLITTSEIIKIEGNLYYTTNSIYMLEDIGESESN